MKYRISEDLIFIRKILNLSQTEIAEHLHVDRKTITRIENNEYYPSCETIESIYNFAYKKNIKINKIKEMLYKEENPNAKVLFHGSKEGLKLPISLDVGRSSNDFGKGFYCGESDEQTSSFVSRFDNSSVYIIEFKNNDLHEEVFNVDQEWMLAIAYFRGKLDNYKENKIIKQIIEKVKRADYICAPIADNRMFRIIDRFIDGEITDEQCKHCLAATNLGNQYVFLTENAVNNLTILENCFLSKKEREDLLFIKENDLNDSDNKVKFAIIKYKNSGKYIEEILS